jgi:hypothetical protein
LTKDTEITHKYYFTDNFRIYKEEYSPSTLANMLPPSNPNALCPKYNSCKVGTF